jgi:hypothetical protein
VGNWTKQNFFWGRNSNGQRTHEMCLWPSLAVKEMQIKTTLRFHLTPVRMATIKNTTTNKRWWGWRGKRNPHTLLVKTYSTTTMENNMEASLKN